MTRISKLNQFYFSLFSKCADLAIGPYKQAFYGGSDWSEKNPNYISGIYNCLLLTVIPVLPVMTIISMSLAIVVAFLAALSTMLTYPVVLAIDSCNSKQSRPG
jgi:hypothetical protein